MYGNGNNKAGGYGNCCSFNPNIDIIKGRAEMSGVLCVALLHGSRKCCEETAQMVYMQPDMWGCWRP